MSSTALKATCFLFHTEFLEFPQFLATDINHIHSQSETARINQAIRAGRMGFWGGPSSPKPPSFIVRHQAVQARLRVLEVNAAGGRVADDPVSILDTMSQVVPDRPWAQALILALVRLVFVCVCVACEAVPWKYLFIRPTLERRSWVCFRCVFGCVRCLSSIGCTFGYVVYFVEVAWWCCCKL